MATPLVLTASSPLPDCTREPWPARRETSRHGRLPASSPGPPARPTHPTRRAHGPQRAARSQAEMSAVLRAASEREPTLSLRAVRASRVPRLACNVCAQYAQLAPGSFSGLTLPSTGQLRGIPFALFSVADGVFLHCATTHEPLLLAPWRKSLEATALDLALDEAKKASSLLQVEQPPRDPRVTPA